MNLEIKRPKDLVEGKFGHGARRLNPVRRVLNKYSRPKFGRATVPFDWDKGFDVRDKIGPIPIKNQGTNSSCGRQTGAYFQFITRKLRGIDEGEISARSGYGKFCAIGGGMAVPSLFKDIGTWGANLESVVSSYDVNGVPLTEEQMEDLSWLTPRLEQDAKTRSGYTPFDLPEDIEEIACAVRDWGCAMWEIGGFNNGSWLTANPVAPVGTVPSQRWYHFMTIIGAKNINGVKKLLVLNSWGKGVGDNGVQYFGEEWMPFIVDAFTMIYNANIRPVDSNVSFWAMLLRLWRGEFLLPSLA